MHVPADERMDGGSSAPASHPTPSGRLARLGKDPEWVIVLVMVGSAVLSALAFWQATSLSGQATELANQARFAAVQQSQSRSAFQANVANDQGVLLGCLSSIARRDGALAEHSRTFDSRLLQTLVEAERTRIALGGLLLSDSRGDCKNYDVERAMEWASLANQQGGTSDAASLLLRSEVVAAREPVALRAAVLFAVALLLLTLADAAGPPRWKLLWIVAASAPFTYATALATEAFSTTGGLDVSAVLLPVGILVVLLLTALAVAGTALGRPTPERVEVPGEERQRLRRIRRRLDRDVRVWAEILGAVTLVVFALSALWLGDSTNRERQALVDADSSTTDARRALELGEQSALAVLEYVAQLSELDASLAGWTQPTQDVGAASTGPDEAARRAVLARWAEEKQVWARLARSGDALEPGGGCLNESGMLAWEQMGRHRQAPQPGELMEMQTTDPDVLGHMLVISSTASARCEIMAELRTSDAQRWDETASLFTVALVGLGLAGFLFALAADRDRTSGPSRWLLGAAILGLTAGMAITWSGVSSLPPDRATENVLNGSQAYADSQVAAAVSDCKAARATAAEAVKALESFARAHVLQADAWACDSRTWLIAPGMDDERLGWFLRGTQRAIDEKIQDNASVWNLGWGKMLAGLRAEGNVRSSLLGEGLDLTNRALAGDPSNPFLCFNLALGTLALGEEAEAVELYRVALEGLREGAPDAPCAPSYRDQALEDYVVLSALGDLELLPEGPLIQTVRDLLVSGEQPIGEVPALPALDRLALHVLPQQIGVYSEKVDVDTSLSIIWYYRASPGEAWGVLVTPSTWTFEAGKHAELVWPLERILPKGEYRADLYLEGRRVRRLMSEDDWWAAKGLQASKFKWLELPDLGLSVVVPETWRLMDRQPGVEATIGGAGGRVAFHRDDGVGSEDLPTDLSHWTSARAEEWRVPWDTTANAPADVVGFLGFDKYQIQAGGPGRLAGIGHTQYMVAPEGGELATTDAEHASCPGTAVKTVVQSTDVAVSRVIWLSLRLAPVHTVNAPDVRMLNPFQSPQFSIEYPPNWKTMGCPGRFVGIAPEQDENVFVSAERYAGTLTEYVKSNLMVFQNGDEFPGFHVEEQVPIELASGVRGERIRYTWRPSADLEVRQTLVLAVAGGRGYALTFTTTVEADHDGPSLDLLLASFGPRATASPVVAICRGCTTEQGRKRQAALDEVASRLAVVDDASCSDATDSLKSAGGVVVRCAFADGFTVDVALWPSASELARHSDGFLGQPDALHQTWYLVDPADPTGQTVEWQTAEGARFYWTYDNLLISADATLVGGDQARLSKWWQETAALLRP